MSTHGVMLKTVVEAYRDGVLVAGPTPYAGHPENAQHLARRTALETRADFVRVLDESGIYEQWSQHLDEHGRPKRSDRGVSPPGDDTTSSSADLPSNKVGSGDQKPQQPTQSGEQDQNKKMARSQDPSLKTKEERVPDRNVQPGVGGVSTGGSSDGTSST
jgi:hypothetical protein